MRIRSLSRILGASSVAALALACSSTVDVAVSVVDPCNQQTVEGVKFLEITPRFGGVDSVDLSTIVSTEGGSASGLEIPLKGDFQLVVKGYDSEEFLRPAALGLSAVRDLSNAKDTVDIRVPFARVNSFYKTTNLLEPGQCSQLMVGRFGATATFLPDNGRVLVVGGASFSNENGHTLISYTRMIELYDPDTGMFEPVAELRVGGARAFHTATLLSDGRVLIAGGEVHISQTPESLKSAMIIDARDPKNVVVSDGLVMQQARTGHIAQRLPDGRVVLAGGRLLSSGGARPEDHAYLPSIEIFDPERGAFTTPADANNRAVELTAARYGHTGLLLKTGKDILISGGMNAQGPVPNMEVLHIEGAAVRTVKSDITLGIGPIQHAADIAPTGEVLLSGGYATIADAEPRTGLPKNASANVEMFTFDETTTQVRRLCTATMSTGRGFHSASITGRSVVFIGGRGTSGMPLPSSEVAILNTGASCFVHAPEVQMMTDARAQHATARLETSGEVLVVGGRQQDMVEQFGRSIDSAEIFSPAREP